jgi:iron complex transport system permease protein
MVVGTILLIACSLLSLLAGSYTIEWSEFVQLFTGKAQDLTAYVFYELRLPRVVGAALVGALMAISGAALQGLFRNPLADPGLIGVASGAAMFAVITIASGLSGFLSTWGLPVHFTLPLMAFIGALVAAMLPLRLATRSSSGIALLLLLGICIQFFAGAVTSAVFYLADDEALRTITFWLMGSFSGLQWSVLLPLVLAGVPAALVLVRQSQALNLLTLGEEHAVSTGVDLRRTRRLVIGATALAVGISVAVAGAIGFIGLIAPHFARIVFGHDHRVLLPASAISGAFVAVAADAVARSLFTPQDLPVGILTAFIGTGVVFTILLQRRRKILTL